MKEKRKLPYSVTLYPEVADALCKLDDPKGKLSVGVARAQALLALPGVMEFARNAEAEDRERYEEGLRLAIARHQAGGVMPGAADLPLEQLVELYVEDYVRRDRNRRTAGFRQSAREKAAENERLEQQAEQLVRRVFAVSAAAFHAGEPLPLHEELNTPELRPIRAQVFQRCRDAFGWDYGPRPGAQPPPSATIATVATNETAPGSQEGPDTRTLEERIEDVFGEPEGAARPLPEAHQGPTQGDVTRPPDELHGSDSSSVQDEHHHQGPRGPVTDPGPMTDEERAGIAALEAEARGELDEPAAPTTSADPALHGSASSSVQGGALPLPDEIGEPAF